MDAVKYLEATAAKMPISSNTMKDDPNNVLLMFNQNCNFWIKKFNQISKSGILHKIRIIKGFCESSNSTIISCKGNFNNEICSNDV